MTQKERCVVKPLCVLPLTDQGRQGEGTKLRSLVLSLPATLSSLRPALFHLVVVQVRQGKQGERRRQKGYPRTSRCRNDR